MKKYFRFKAVFIFTSALCFFASYVYSQTIISAGNVNGTWTKAGSPYKIQGPIQIPDGQTLIIDPGVLVEFQGYYKLNVQGQLLAIGAVTDTIVFTAANTTSGWRGIRFDNTPATNDTSRIKYCKLQYGKATGTSPDDYGGAVFINNFSKIIISNCCISNCAAATAGGGIYTSGGGGVISYNRISDNQTQNSGAGIYSKGHTIIAHNIIVNNNANGGNGGGIISYDLALIHNNFIINNFAHTGAGIYSYGNINNLGIGDSIFNNIIMNNSASYGGGGIYVIYGNPFISKNTISNNTSGRGAGIYYGGSHSGILTNNLITNNTASNYGGGVVFGSTCNFLNNSIVSNNASMGGGIADLYNNTTPIIRNCVIWGNTASVEGSQLYLNDEPNDPDFYYCDVQGGSAAFGLNGNFYTGTYQNNIDADPRFVSPTGGAGTGFDGVNANWSLQSSSPCIDTGDPGGTYPATDIAGNPRVIAGRIDMGAYEYNTLIAPITQTQQIICNGDATASLTVNASGGTPSDTYTYLWSNGSTLQSITGLSPGTYSVLVNATLCQCHITSTYTVIQPAKIILSPTHKEDNACNAINDGIASVNVSGGQTPYTYLWSNGNTVNSISGLAPGNYSVTITDNIGCARTNTISIGTVSTTITANILAKPDTCMGTVGEITTSPAGGTGVYIFVWSTGSSAQNISGLGAGNYTVTVSDSLGCSVSGTSTVGIYTSTVTPTLTSKPDTCTGHVGIALSNPSGGTAPYSYLWNNSSTTKNISALVTNNYSVTITDKNGCSATSSILVGSYTRTITPTLTSKADTCTGHVGVAISNPTGGTAPYSYLWSNSSTTKNISALTANTYSLTVTDKNGCNVSGSILIGSYTRTITPTLTGKPDTCTGHVGVAMSNPTGGTSPYSYLWSNSSTTKNISSLATNNYSVTITDKNGCSASGSILVGSYTGTITPTLTGKPDTCTGHVGVAMSNPTGGTSPYSYLWSNSSTTKNISSLATNNYSVTITDKNGCSVTGSVLVGTYTKTITATFTSFVANCHKANGSITVNPGGGTNPYSYLWSNGASVQSMNNIFAGSYTVNISDKNGCIKTAFSTVGTTTAIATPEICLVTVDSLSQNNVIVWDKTPFTGTAIKSFLIYRDTANNNFAPIGKVPFNSFSEFIDTVRALYTANGNPNFSSWRYKIAMEDSCGNISPLSLYHQSLFIQNNSANFNWTDYKIEGQPVPIPSLSNYLFQRDDFSTGNYVTIATLSASSNLSTDPQYSTFQNTANWRVQTQWSISCTPSHKNGTRAIKTTKSNTIKKVNPTWVNENELDRMVKVYPNPSSGKLTISSLEKISFLELVNLMGERVFLKNLINSMQESLNLDEPRGIYFLHVKTSKGTTVKKIIIE